MLSQQHAAERLAAKAAAKAAAPTAKPTKKAAPAPRAAPAAASTPTPAAPRAAPAAATPPPAPAAAAPPPVPAAAPPAPAPTAVPPAVVAASAPDNVVSHSLDELMDALGVTFDAPPAPEPVPVHGPTPAPPAESRPASAPVLSDIAVPVNSTAKKLKSRPYQMVIDNRPGSRVSDADVRTMVAASNILLPELAAAWGYSTPTAVFLPDLLASGKRPDPGAWLFHMIAEDPSTPGALAYHTEEGDVVDGYILTKTILNNGGVPLYNKSRPQSFTIASALFHELAEAFIDPTCNGWWQDAEGVFYCAEVCDPVESNNIIVDVGKVKVALSDFVFPAWKDIEGGPGLQYNYAKTLHYPFQLDVGGYYIKFDPASDSGPVAVFGDKMPDWLKHKKMASRRASMRAVKPL